MTNPTYSVTFRAIPIRTFAVAAGPNFSVGHNFDFTSAKLSIAYGVVVIFERQAVHIAIISFNKKREEEPTSTLEIR